MSSGTSGTRKKINDAQLISLNSVGISLGGIGQHLGVHHTTVTHRLKELGIPPADTRRAFMEDIYDSLTDSQRQWLVAQLGPGHSIKDYVRSLIIKEFVARQG